MTGQTLAARVVAFPVLVLYGVHMMVGGPGVKVDAPIPPHLEEPTSPPEGGNRAPRRVEMPHVAIPVPDDAMCADPQALARQLSELIKEPTVSRLGEPNNLPEGSAAAMHRVHDKLAKMYPKLHASAKREVVESYSLLYNLRGSDPALRPLVILCHLDVSPVEAGSEKDWTHPPYAGHIDDTFVWGRGAIDMKNICAMTFHAVEQLLSTKSYAPKRGLYLAVGHDEEVGGRLGAMSIVELLKKRNIEVEMVLDEGTGLTEGGTYPFVPRHAAFISTAEKGYMSVEVSTNVTGGGHSSRPQAAGTPITALSKAVSTLQANQFSTKILPPMTDFLDAWANQMVTMQPLRFLAQNWRLWKPLVRHVLGSDPQFNFFVKTTTAVTLFNAGVKENVIPASASAVINHRLLPGTTNETVLNHYRRALNNPEVKITPTSAMPNGWMPASPVAPMNSVGFANIKAAIKATFGDDMPVLPFLLMAGADGRHYVHVAQGRVYRFSPLWLGPKELALMHATDERVRIDSLVQMCTFFTTFIKLMCEG